MAGSWQIELLKSAEKDLKAISRDLGEDAYDEIMQDILDLEENPLPPGYVHLRSTKNDYRIYTYRSMYRVVYRVLFGKKKVLIARVRPRGIVYSGYDRW